MPRRCSICEHPDRQAIHQALEAHEALRTIAARWSVSKTALLRHRETHLARVPGLPHSPHPIEAGPQNVPTPPLSPEVQETLDEYQKVDAILDALRTLTQDDWQHWARWQVAEYQVMLPLWCWRAELYLKLRAWDIEPFRLSQSAGRGLP